MFDLIKKEAEKRKKELANLLVKIIKIKSNSSDEGELARFLKNYLLKAGFKKVKIDAIGNVIAEYGKNKSRSILIDGHMDIVGAGDSEKWNFPPYSGKIYNGNIYGRGTVDQKGGLASAIFSVEILRKLKFIPSFKIILSCSVNEEDCEGMALDYILKKIKPKPFLTIITEPSNLNIMLGQRGKLELAIETYGISAHAGSPEKGKNPIYRISRVISEIEKLNKRISHRKLLERGNVIVSEISSESPSINSVPYYCRIHIDRRLGPEEDIEEAIKEIKNISKKYDTKLSIINYKSKTWKGYSFHSLRKNPPWLIKKDSKYIKKAKESYKLIFNKNPKLGFWHFSTNGVASMGKHNIPTIGFGPGKMKFAHLIDENIPIEDLVDSAKFYAVFIYNLNTLR